MSDEWSVLSWKQKKAVRLALKNDENITMSFLKGIYSDSDRRRQAMKTMNRQGIIEEHDRLSNNFVVNHEKVPDGVIESCMKNKQ